ncbi:MAG TPA: hypothetical protein VKB69_10015 [Micromonosporaceae bacterium]|nr:hypothetical protein [Micromonosporaceae bacterium]
MPTASLIRHCGVGASVICVALLTACTSSTPKAAPSAPTAPTGGSSASAPPASPPPAAATGPTFDPGNFGTVVDNPYFPLKPGSTWVYQGVRDGVPQKDVVVATGRTKVVDGVTAVVVTDTATHGSTLLEKTEDWYAQDKQGNVWYLGEATAAYDNGKVDTEGSWTSGVDGAVPGIIMPAHPRVTDSFRQEFLKDHAEDTFWVVQDGVSTKVPAGSYTGVIRTLEFTRLEPDVIDNKFYAPGVGIIREASASGPNETADLVSFTSG